MNVQAARTVIVATIEINGTTIGRLICVLQTRVKYHYDISFSSRFRAYPRVKQLMIIATVVDAMKSDPQYLFLPWMHKEALQSKPSRRNVLVYEFH